MVFSKVANWIFKVWVSHQLVRSLPIDSLVDIGEKKWKKGQENAERGEGMRSFFYCSD